MTTNTHIDDCRHEITDEAIKFSHQTISILKQFAAVNSGIVISPGNLIATRTDDVVAEAVIAETFASEVCLPDIHEFLRVLALFTEPVCKFEQDCARIKEADGTAETLYELGKPGSIVLRPIRKKPFPAEQITLSIGSEQWETLRKALGINVAKETAYCTPELRVESDGQKVKLAAYRHSHTQKLQYRLAIQAVTNGFECRAVLEARKLPSLPGPYSVTVYPTFVEFKQSDFNLLYYVASEPGSSTWGGKRSYQVKVTKTTSEHCCIPVEAHSPEEAEALARQVTTFDWREENGQRIEFKALVS